MLRRNGHSSFPKPIRLYSWRQRLVDSLSPSFFLAVAYAAAIIVLCLDIFYWRA